MNLRILFLLLCCVISSDLALAQSVRYSTGTGFFVSRNGHIVTNAHVTAFGKRFKVVMNDKREFPAELIGEDPISDLAVIRIKAYAPAR